MTGHDKAGKVVHAVNMQPIVLPQIPETLLELGPVGALS